MANKVSEEQTRKAVAALLKFVGDRDSNNLLEEDELLYLVRLAAACGNGSSVGWRDGFAFAPSIFIVI